MGRVIQILKLNRWVDINGGTIGLNMRASLCKTLKLHSRYYPVSKTLTVTLSNEAIPLSKNT